MRSYTMNMAKLRNTVISTDKLLYTVTAFDSDYNEVFFNDIPERKVRSLIRDLKAANYTKIFSLIQE